MKCRVKETLLFVVQFNQNRLWQSQVIASSLRGLIALIINLGLVNLAPAATPLTDVSQLWKGVSDVHSCVLMMSGGVKCWGYNISGQLDDNSTFNRLTPVDVIGLKSGVIAIALGGEHSCALTTDGGVKCWGDNIFGQLGDGSTTNSLTPIDVSGLTSGVNAIALGGGNALKASYSCALTTSGGVKCWGSNFFGKLGDNSTTDRATPVDVIVLPEMDVQGNGVSIVAGDTTPSTVDHTDFGSTPINTPISKTFTITNTGEADLNLSDKPLVALTGTGCNVFNVTTELTTPIAAISGTTNFTIEYKPIAAGKHSCTVSIPNDDPDENLYSFSIQGSTPTEIDVQGNGTSITDGDTTPNTADHTDFGSTLIGTPVSHTFTIANTGEAILNLSGTPLVALTGADCAAFSVTIPPTTPVAAISSGATFFTIRYNPPVVGTHTCTVSIPNDDIAKA